MAWLVGVTRRSRWVGMLVFLALVLALPSAPVGVAGNAGEVVGTILPAVRDFQLVSEDEGWVLAEQHLYWTSDSGQAWQDITPPGLGKMVIQDVTFFDTRQGWLVGTSMEESGIVTYILVKTSDCGATWHQKPLALFEPGDPGSLAAAVYLHLLDPQTGWLVVKQATSSNFSLGSLFRTTDGGDQWEQLTIPIGAPVYFATSEAGWTAGGPAGDKLYRTQDGGQTWQPQTVGAQPGMTVAQRRLYHLPVFDTPLEGVLPLVSLDSGSAQVEFYATVDSGETWSLATRVPLSQEIATGAQLPFSVIDADHWVMSIPNSQQLLQIVNRTKIVAVAGQGLPDGVIAELDMATLDIGWAMVMSGDCTRSPLPEKSSPSVPKNATRCHLDSELVGTRDGGVSWTTSPLPQADPPLGPQDESARSPTLASAVEDPSAVQELGSRTEPFVGEGFDTCEIPTLSQLQTWSTSSPYDAVNLYMGGSCRGCPNSGLTADFLIQASQQGWRFIPTWVGPQSACYGAGCGTISSDPAIAYNQGVTEADAALAVAINLGLAEPDGSGTIAYYDLEAYGGVDPTCRNAAKSFINGWTARLHQRGSEAGVYTSSCGGAISDFATISNVPDAIWPAATYTDYYDPTATVWNVPCLDNGLWADHQRIRQYTWGHNEAWGGVTLNIDCDVIDGIVANVGGTCCGCLPASCCSAAGIAQASDSATATGWADRSALSSATLVVPNTTASICQMTSVQLSVPIVEEENESGVPEEPELLDVDLSSVVDASELEPIEDLPASVEPIDSSESGASLAQREAVESQRVPPTSVNYSIAKSVFGSGGGKKTSTHYVMNSTQGQSTDLARRTSSSYVLVPGYWGRWIPRIFDYRVYLPVILRNH